MVIFSRMRDETILIGEDIEVTVVDIRGDKVRLGITQPKGLSVHRKEVYDAIRRENRDAARRLAAPGPRSIAPGPQEPAAPNAPTQQPPEQRQTP